MTGFLIMCALSLGGCGPGACSMDAGPPPPGVHVGVEVRRERTVRERRCCEERHVRKEKVREHCRRR